MSRTKDIESPINKSSLREQSKSLFKPYSLINRLDMSITFSPLVPVRRRIAKSSASLRTSGPSLRKRSRGRFCFGMSRIFMCKNNQPLEFISPAKNITPKTIASPIFPKNPIGKNQLLIKPKTPSKTAIALSLIIELCSAFIFLKSLFLV